MKRQADLSQAQPKPQDQADSRRADENRLEEDSGPIVPLRLGGLANVHARREAICLALAAAETCWVTPVVMGLIWVRASHSPLLLWLGMFILMLGYFYFYRALVSANLSLLLQQGLLVTGLLLSAGLILRFHVYTGVGTGGTGSALWPFHQWADLAAAMPITWITVMVLIFVWARAVHMANRSLLSGSIGFSFRVGVVLLIVLVFFVRVLTDLDATAFVIPYFFFALIAVALARIEEVSHLPNSTRISFSGYWIGSTVVAVAVLVVVGTGVAFFFYGGGLRRVLQWLYPVWFVLQIIVVGLGMLLLMLLDWLSGLLSLDLSALGQGLGEAFDRLRQLLASPPPLLPPGAEDQSDPVVFAILKVAITVGIPLAAVSLVLLLAWRRIRHLGREDGGTEDRESLLSANAVAQNLRAMVQEGLDRLGELSDRMSHLGSGSRFLATISIRRIYANLVRLAAEAGYPRAKAQTPYEYLPLLHKAWPGSKDDLAVITEAYVKSHYGQVPDTREELQRIRDCWDRVRSRDANAPK
ncbi:MAG: DUF4129 domain-containing protein [Anaerolineae bacterium]